MTELRDYQQELVQRVRAALGPSKVRVMMQLPTGGGKTIIASHLLAGVLRNGRKAVWLTHRKELADQTCRMLPAAHIPAMTDVRWYPGMDAPAMSSGVVILMAQTVSRRTSGMSVWTKYGQDDLLVIDEAHHAAARGWTRAMQQWPGRIIGMTATPWRLSEKEGFDHLFCELVCGPQTSDLQSGRWLCQARVLIPQPEQRILGGEVDLTGEYTESGIESANRGRRDVMTAQALRFYQQHTPRRQTIIYAVSVGHANNLAAIFNDANIPAAVILGDTPSTKRARLIADFKNKTLKVLVNVAVATEGFDLPDASCIILARPTKSLALYLQTVGRGLRPKEDGGGCVLLDLAGNAITHGLPEEHREWSLRPRGEQAEGEAPVVWCEHCGTVSPARSQNCPACGALFGKDCERCVKWRPWKRWSLETYCGDAHALVCDLCHRDAHVQAHLPIPDEIRSLSGDNAMDSEISQSNDAPQLSDENDELESELALILKNLLEEERRKALGTAEARQRTLQFLIGTREAQLGDESALKKLFTDYLDDLPDGQRPRGAIERSYRHVEWHTKFKQELSDWQEELARVKNQPINKQLIFNGAQERLIQLLRREAEAAGLLPQRPREIQAVRLGSGDNLDPVGSVAANGWYRLSELKLNPNEVKGRSPRALQLPRKGSIPIQTWCSLLVQIAEWLIQKGTLTRDRHPIYVRKARTALIDREPIRPDHRSKELSNGLYINTNFTGGQIIRMGVGLLEQFSEDPSQFSLQLS